MGLRLSAWLKMAVVAVLMVWLFYTPNLRRLWDKTNPFYGEPNWGHSIFVPIVGLYYLYFNRDELLAAKVKPLVGLDFGPWRFITSGVLLVGALLVYVLAPRILPPSSVIEYATSAATGIGALALLAMLLDWGLGTLFFGLLIFGYGIYPGQNDWLKDLGMVVTLFGVVLTLCGWQVMRITWFPILFLICALPWPGLVYSKIAGPLQNLAAWVSVGVLNVCGVGSEQQGTKIVISRGIMVQPRILNVAEACAGLKALMTFLSLGATVAFLSNRPLWQKIIITLSAIPIAIFCNVMRVAGQGLLDYYVSEQLSQSFAHQMVGLVMMLPAFLLILLVSWLVDQIFIEEIEVVPSKPSMGKTATKQPAPAAAVATAPRRQNLAPTTPAEGA